MPTIYPFLLLNILFVSCSKPSQPTDQVVDRDVELKIREFKISFFMSCIDYGYEGDACMDSILNEDVSQMGDFPLGIYGYQAADSLANQVYKAIIADSIKLMNRYDYEAGKKRVFKFCLNYYSSNKIDSVARELFAK